MKRTQFTLYTAANGQRGAPSVSLPAVKLSQFSHDEHGKKIKIHFDHGTTTLGFQYQGGVVLAVDSRATGGQFIGKYNI
ncbi:unnamed protein product [Timema podura]|uniref:Uncharacterized protein n=1 Tax=Timema podura TaxID=61482 RepID=A0ABN7P1I8_TIMPD|nr:unnamed protein product [Timema podura]